MRDNRIAIDVSRALQANRTGTENYNYQITQALIDEKHYKEVLLYARGDQDQPGEWNREGVEFVSIEMNSLWTQYGLAQETWKSKPDLLFIPAHVIPFFKHPRVKTVATVHDIRTEFLPQHSSFIQKLYLNSWMEKLRAGIADHLIAVSETTKRDLVEQLGVKPEKVTVVYNGYDQDRYHFSIRNQPEIIHDVLEKYQITKPFIFFVGSIQPRKNIVRIIQAFNLLLSDHSDVELIIAGGNGWLNDDIYAEPERLGIEDNVRFIGYVDDDDLPYLYASCEFLAYPSLYEGFGIPILEALACGTPVVTSNLASMPEVGGAYAEYVDPYSVESIKKGFVEAFSRTFDRSAVTKHLQQFTWKTAAQRTIQVFDTVLST